MKKIICFFILIIVFTVLGTNFYLDKIESRIQREAQILEEKRAEEQLKEERLAEEQLAEEQFKKKFADDTAKYYFKYNGKVYKKDRWMLYDDIFK